MGKIVSIPLEENFLETFVTNILLQHKDEFDRIAVVFPGKRPSLYIHKLLQDILKKPFLSPVIFSMEEFIDFILEKNLLIYKEISPYDAVYKIYKIIKETQQSFSITTESIRKFFYWGIHIYKFFNEIDQELIKPEMIASIQKIAEYETLPLDIKNILKEIAEVYIKFIKSIENENLVTRGYKYRKAADVINTTDLENIKKLYFAGIFATTGSEKHIIKTLFEKDKADVIFHGEPADYLKDTRQLKIEEWKILGKLLQYLGVKKENVIYIKNTAKIRDFSHIKIYSAPNAVNEILCAYEIVKNWEDKDSSVPQQVIVMPSSELLMPALQFVCDRINRKFNISMGYKLSHTPLYNLIDAVLKAQINARDKGSSVEYDKSDYLRVLLHPYVKNLKIYKNDSGVTRQIIHRLNNVLNGDVVTDNVFIKKLSAQLYLNIDNIPKIGSELSLDNIEISPVDFIEIVNIINKECFKNFEVFENIYQLAEHLQKFIDFILDKGPYRFHILSGEIVKNFWELLEKIKDSEFSKQRLSKDEKENRLAIIEFIQYFIESTGSIQFDTEPLETLQLVGVLETRALNFKNTVILDVNEGKFPPPKEIDPLIPLDVRKELGMHSYEDEEEMAKYYFYRLIKGSDEVHLIYRDTPELPRSRFIERIIWEKEKKEKRIFKKEEVIKEYFVPPFIKKEEPLVIEKSEEVLNRLKKGFIFHPTTIDIYMNCPLKFYFSNILKLKEYPVIEREIKETTRGDIIHSILAELFKEYIGKKANFDEIIKKLYKIIERMNKTSLYTGEYYIFNQIARYKVEGYIRRIQSLREDFIVRGVELTIPPSNKQGPVYFEVDKEIKVMLRGRIDRIDEMNDGEIRIIDYKTGGGNEVPNKTGRDYNTIMQEIEKESDETEMIQKKCEIIRQKIKSFQLPIYLYLYKKYYHLSDYENLNAALILFMSKDIRNIYNELFSNNVESKTEQMENYFLLCLRDLFKELFNKDIPFKPREKTDCRYCIYTHFCRKEGKFY